MADQFGNIANDVSNLQQLSPAQIMQLLGGVGQSAVAGVAGAPGDISNMFAGHAGNQNSQSAFPTYLSAQNTLSNYTGFPTTSSFPSAANMHGLTALHLAAMIPQLLGRGMQPSNYQPTGQPPADQAPASGPSWISRLLSGQLGGLTGSTPAY